MCVEVCPTRAIAFVDLREDFLASGTPKMDFVRGGCIMSMKCIDVCPSGALRKITSSEAKIGTAEIDRSNCLAWTRDACLVCFKVCPVQGAITLDETAKPHVNPEKCNGCGICVYECPAPSYPGYAPGMKKPMAIDSQGAKRLES